MARVRVRSNSKDRRVRSEALASLHYTDSEFVFGLVAAVGTDLEGFGNLLRDHLKGFQYTAKPTRLSSFLDELPQGWLETTLHSSPEFKRISSHMDAGNEVRRRYSRGDALALHAVSTIRKQRQQRGDGPLASTVHVLNSLKHPDEVQALRRIYGPGFFLIALHSHEEDRLAHLAGRKHVPPPRARELVARDQSEEQKLGQRTRDTFQLADVFIESGPKQEEQLKRFLELLFGNPHITPTLDEHAMFLAYATSLRSADLSRQVGAVVVSHQGETIATGANDVPRFGGGLYWPTSDDGRDYKIGHDTNAAAIREIAIDVVRRLVPSADVDDLPEIAGALRGSRLYDLTEFGRAVHAEMEALLACARVGVTPIDGTVYTTTFPCHNCAKHIVAAGIRRVVYVEPYPKSKALGLHGDSIELEPRDGGASEQKKVRFSPFVGVAARRYFDLFSMRLSTGGPVERKEDDGSGKAVKWEPQNASPRVFMAPVSYLQREVLAVSDFFATAKGVRR